MKLLYSDEFHFFADGTEILKDVKEENVDRIISVLKQFTFEENGYTAEAKLEKFFHSCRNMRKREAKKGEFNYVCCFSGFVHIPNYRRLAIMEDSQA